MSWETWTITAGEDRAVISNFGATVLEWSVEDEYPCLSSRTVFAKLDHSDAVLKKQRRQVIDGYHSQAEANSLDGYRSAVLAPWSNRIRDGKFSFQGEDFDVSQSAPGGELGLHGLVFDKDFKAVSQSDNEIVLEYTIPETDFYPFEVLVQVTYRIFSDPHRLEADFKATNLSAKDAPITLGWHPYLVCQDGGVDTTRVALPGQVSVVTDEKILPLAGLEAFSRAACPITLVGRRDLDFGYTHLVEQNGKIEATIDHKDCTQTVVQMYDVETGIGKASFQVYSGQDLEVRRGLSVAVEPLLAMTDAFNRSECTDLITVSAGETQVLKTALEFRYLG